MANPSLTQRIDSLEKELLSLKQDLPPDDEEARQRLVGLSFQSLSMFEKPAESIWRMTFEPHIHASIRTALEMGLLDALNENKEPVTADALAKITGGDKLLIVRLLRPLTAAYYIIETGFETYAPGPVCKAFATPALRSGFKFMIDETGLACLKLPSYLAHKGYKNIPSSSPGNFEYSHNTHLPMLPYLIQPPRQLTNFLTMLEGWREGRTEWYDVYPVEDSLIKGFDDGEDNAGGDGAALLVDIGGGHGYDVQNFSRRFPSAPGRLILQDLAPVIDDIRVLDERVVRMEHHFFTEQPVQGARAYYLRSICHDWSDGKCKEILGRTVAAMKPGYSRGWINDWILPDTGSGMIPALMDVNMMAVLSGMERTESQWRVLLEGVGLEIVRFWTVGKDAEGLVEAVRRS